MNEYNFRYISTLQINKMTKESEMERKLDIEGELHYMIPLLPSPVPPPGGVERSGDRPRGRNDVPRCLRGAIAQSRGECGSVRPGVVIPS